jgi:polyisoprenoid-binding protein YceI
LLEVTSGTVSFEVATNVPGVEVKGKTNTVTAHVQLSTTPEGLNLQQIEFSVPVRGLSTGMKVRDEHMQKYIFTTPDGQMPDVVFSAENGLCKAAGDPRNLGCEVAGILKIRGHPHPVTMTFTARQEKESPRAFHATLDTTIKLTDFEIDAPSQFGVKPSNDVKVHLDFAAKEKSGGLAEIGASK